MKPNTGIAQVDSVTHFENAASCLFSCWIGHMGPSDPRVVLTRDSVCCAHSTSVQTLILLLGLGWSASRHIAPFGEVLYNCCKWMINWLSYSATNWLYHYLGLYQNSPLSHDLSWPVWKSWSLCNFYHSPGLYHLAIQMRILLGRDWQVLWGGVGLVLGQGCRWMKFLCLWLRLKVTGRLRFMCSWWYLTVIHSILYDVCQDVFKVCYDFFL